MEGQHGCLNFRSSLGPPRGVVAQILNLTEECLIRSGGSLMLFQSLHNTKAGLYQRPIRRKSLLREEKDPLQSCDALKPFSDEQGAFSLHQMFRQYDCHPSARSQELQAALQAENFQRKRLLLMSKLESSHHLHRLLPHDAAERRIG